MIVNRKIKTLILDTSAFIKNLPLWELGEEFYCVSDVIREIKDKQTRHHIDALPIQLHFREPSPASIKFISDFTKKTGDFATLSLADIKILALTYELEVEYKGGASHLRFEPLKQRTEQIASVKPPPSTNSDKNFDVIEGFYVSSQKKGNSAVDAGQVSSFSSHTSDEEETSFFLRMEHLSRVNDHLTLYPYIGGYVVKEEDFYLFAHLLGCFPLLSKLAELALRHRIGGQWPLFREICQKHPFPHLKESEAHHSNATNEECESLKVAKQFSRDYSTQWPHFVRWFLHLLTFNEKEFEGVSHCCQNTKEVSFPSNQSIEKIFNRLSHHDVGGLENGNEKDCSDISDDFGNLKMNSKNTLVTRDVISSSIDQMTHHSQNKTSQDESEYVSHVESEDKEFENEDGGYEDTDGSQDDDDDEEEELSYGNESDEDEGWITPSNIKSIKKNCLDETPLSDSLNVACITGDFAIQNTLKHIGLHVMGVNGKMIQSVRTFILRCYACYKTTNRMETIFCTHCGHKTLKRVSVTLNPDGTQRIWISTKKPINIRGTKFSIPRPKGGKHGRNPILVADQREVQQRVSKLNRLKNDPMHEDYDARSGLSPFLTRDVYSRSAQLGIIRTGKKQHQGIYYWEQKNPNVPLKKGTRKKKR